MADQLITELIVDARGALKGTAEYDVAMRAAQRATDATLAKVRQLGPAAGEAGQKIEASGRSFSYADKQAAAYLGRLDPLIFAKQKLAGETGRADAALKALDRQLMTGAVTASEHAQKAALLTGRLGELRATSQQLASGQISVAQAMGAMSTQAERNGSLAKAHAGALGLVHEATGKATGSTGQMRFALQNLSFQLNDIATSLASGGSPMRVLAQQGGQVVQVFQQGGGVTSVLGAAGAAIRGMITPVTAAVAGIAALAGGFAVLLSRAQDNAEQLRQFNLILEGTGKSSLTTADNLQRVVRQLRDVGVARADAEAAVAAIALNPRLNPAAAGQIAAAGLDVGERLRLANPHEGITRFASAIEGGVEGVLKLGFALDAVSVKEATAIRLMAAHGEQAAALKKAIELVTQNVSGGYAKSLSDSATAITSIGTAWQNMLTKLSDTTAIQGARDAMVGLLQAVAAVASGKPAADTAARPTGAEREAIVAGYSALPLAWGRKVFELNQRLFGPLFQQLSPGEEAARIRSIDDAARAPRFPVMPSGYADYQSLLNAESSGAVPRGSAQAFAANNNLGGFAAATGAGFGVGALRGPPPTAGAGLGVSADLRTEFTLPNKDEISKTEVELKRFAATEAERTRIARMANVEQQAQNAYVDEYNRRLAEGKPWWDAMQFANIAMAETRSRANIELGKASALQDAETQGLFRYAEALKSGAAAAERVAAEEQARVEVMRQGGDEAQRTAQILDQSAARKQAQLQLAINDNERQIELVQLEASLQGETTETVAVKLSHLQAIHRLQRDGVPLTSEIAQNYLRSADALARTNVQAQELKRHQQEMDSLFRQIGDSISRFIGDAIEGIFDKSKVVDWGKALKSAVLSIGSQIAQSLVIRPLTGSLLSAFGASPAVVQGFGGGSSSGGGLSLGTLFQGGGLLKDLFGFGGGSSGGGMFGGVGSWLNNTVGPMFGFGTGSVGVPITDTAGLLGSFSTRGGDLLGAGSSGGLFGSTTFGSFLGGAGLGFGAGSLLNTLLGGNSMIGTIGSGVGSLAGAAIGSIFPGVGTLIGGLLGGLGGGLFGLFGNKKPRNQSAGGNIDFSTGRVFDLFSGGNAQIDQSTQQVIQQLGAYTQRLLQVSGGRLSGEVLLQNGVNTGFTADSSLPGFEGRFNLGKDPGEVVRTVSLALAQSLEGVSETMRRVIDQVSDPAALDGAIQFAAAYDRIDEAFKSAFAELDPETVGPFAQAMAQIEAIFADMTEKAGQFGLALEPVNAGLEEATRRLRQDFADSLDRAFNEVSGSGFLGQIEDLVEALGDSRREAEAIGLGGDPGIAASIDRLFEAQLGQILGALDTAQLDQVRLAFAGLEEPILALMRSAEDAAAATAQLAEAEQEAQRILAAGADIRAYVDSLSVTASTLSPEAALAGAQALYDETLAAAQAGSAEAYESLVSVADQLLEATEAYYASGGETAAAIAQVSEDLLALPGAAEDLDINELTLQLIDAQRQTTDAILTLDLTAQAVSAGLLNLTLLNEQAAAAAIASNEALAASLIAATELASATLIAQVEADAAEIVAAMEVGIAAIVAGNDARTAELIAGNTGLASEIVALNDMLQETLFDANVEAAAGIIDQNNQATADIIAQYSTGTNELLASASLDAQAIGAAVYDIGDEISRVASSVGNSQIEAGSLYANSQIEATLGAANSIVSAAAEFANSQIAALGSGVNSLIAAGAEYARSTIAMVESAAANLIAAGEAYTSNLISAVSGGLNNLISAEAVYANSQLAAVYDIGNLQLGRLDQQLGWLQQIRDVEIAYGDHANGQRDTMIALLTQLRDWWYSQPGGTGGGVYYDPGPGSDGQDP